LEKFRVWPPPTHQPPTILSASAPPHNYSKVRRFKEIAHVEKPQKIQALEYNVMLAKLFPGNFYNDKS
jgi:hypothetical protein